MKILKTISSLLLGAALLFPTAVFAHADEEVESTGESSFSFGKLFDPVTGESAPYYAPSKASNRHKAVATLPLKYDLRQTHPDWIPLVRDQGKYGVCWAFAATTVGYASLAKESGTAQLLSPKHLAYASSGVLGLHPLSQIMGTNDPMSSGGSAALVYGAWSRYFGPMLESDFPYPADSTNGIDPSPITDPGQISLNAYRLDTATSLPSAMTSTGEYSLAAVLAAKEFIQNNGPLNIGIKAQNGSLEAWYDDTESTSDSNHEVTIIGWDDTYPKSNFQPDQPNSDGAWIVQNSWGSSMGSTGGFGTSGGYYYVSYQNRSIPKFDNITLTSGNRYANNQSYTANASMYMSSYFQTLYAANVFTATKTQAVKAVIVSNATAGTNYEVSIYNHVKDSPSSGKLTAATASRQNMPYGLDTVELSSPAYVNAGEKYAVVVKYSFNVSSGGRAPLFELEKEYASVTSSVPTFTVNDDQLIQPGQTYTSSDGKIWVDFTSRDRRVKDALVGNAFIVALSDPASATAVLDGGQEAKALFGGKSPDLRKGNIVFSFTESNGATFTEQVRLSESRIKVWGFNNKKLGVQSIGVRYPGYPDMYYSINNVIPKISAVHTPTSTLYLKKNSTFTVNAVAFDKPTGADYPITYKSSKTKVLKVNSAGKLTAKSVKKKTKVIVTLKAYNKTKKITVYVVPKAKKLKNAKATIPSKLKVGQVKWITVKTGSATNVKVSFKSSKSAVIKVSKYGQLTAKKKGKAKITVMEGSKKVSKVITVK